MIRRPGKYGGGQKKFTTSDVSPLVGCVKGFRVQGLETLGPSRTPSETNTYPVLVACEPSSSLKRSGCRRQAFGKRVRVHLPIHDVVGASSLTGSQSRLIGLISFPCKIRGKP